MFVSSALGFHFCSDLRTSVRSIAVKRTVFDVDITRTAVREVVWRSIPEMSIELFSKFTLEAS